MRRIFLVGCPRSGTTLLQSLVASHPEVVSFPETHLFSKTISINKILRFFTIYRSKHIHIVQNILEDFNVDFPKNSPGGTYFSTRKWIEKLLPVLDEIALSHLNGKRPVLLLEKTPRHLHFVELIKEVDPDAQFIHMIRKGEEVVASLTEATANSPANWSGSRSIKKSIFWWNRSIKISEQFIGRDGHHFVCYQELVNKTDQVLQNLFSRIGLKFDPSMIDSFHDTAGALINEQEIWKSKNLTSDISGSNKFDRFTEDEKKMITNSLRKFDYSKIRLNKADS